MLFESALMGKFIRYLIKSSFRFTLGASTSCRNKHRVLSFIRLAVWLTLIRVVKSCLYGDTSYFLPPAYKTQAGRTGEYKLKIRSDFRPASGKVVIEKFSNFVMPEGCYCDALNGKKMSIVYCVVYNHLSV